MEKKKVILHVGFHKTATSSFQDTCARERDKIKSQGYIYPIFKVAGLKMLPSNHGIAIKSCFMPQPEKFFINLTWGISDRIEQVNKHYFEQLDDLFSTNENIIISGEAISVMSKEMLIKIRDFIHNKGYEIQVICVVRSPYSFLCSNLQEIIKIGDGFVGRLDKKINVPKKTIHIKNLEEVFDKVDFVSFSVLCKHSDGPVGALFDLMNINYNNFDFSSSNIGNGNFSTRLLADINKKFWIFKQGKINPNARSKDFFDFGFDEEKFLLTSKELLPCIKDLDEENRWLEKKFGEKFCDKKYGVSKKLEISREEAELILDKINDHEIYLNSVVKFIFRNMTMSYFSFFKILFLKKKYKAFLFFFELF